MVNNRPIDSSSLPLRDIDLKMPYILYFVILLDCYYFWQNLFVFLQLGKKFKQRSGLLHPIDSENVFV